MCRKIIHFTTHRKRTYGALFHIPQTYYKDSLEQCQWE